MKKTGIFYGLLILLSILLVYTIGPSFIILQEELSSPTTSMSPSDYWLSITNQSLLYNM